MPSRTVAVKAIYAIPALMYLVTFQILVESENKVEIIIDGSPQNLNQNSAVNNFENAIPKESNLPKKFS